MHVFQIWTLSPNVKAGNCALWGFYGLPGATVPEQYGTFAPEITDLASSANQWYFGCYQRLVID